MKSREDLTPQQKRVLTIIEDYAQRNGLIPPTLREIATGMGISSKSRAHLIVRQLEEAGFLRKHPRIHRGIEIVRAA